MVQISHPYMTTGKTIALTRLTYVDKVMSLLSNMVSSLVITFLPRSKGLLISWLQSSSAVILESKKIKSVIVSIVSPFAMNRNRPHREYPLVQKRKANNCSILARRIPWTEESGALQSMGLQRFGHD